MPHASHLSHVASDAATDHFLERWHAYVAAPSEDGLDAVLADDAAISSPAFWSPKQDRAYVATILRAVTRTFENFRYDREWVDGREVLLEFSANIGSKELRGIDRITVSDDGRIKHIEVMIRPANALMALAEHVKAAFGTEAA